MRAVIFLSLGLLAAPMAAGAQTCGLYEAAEPGDTAEAVADRCGVALSDLLELNPSLRGAAPPEGTVLRLSGGPRTSLNADGANEGASAEYAYNITGTWRGADGACDREAGSWSFAYDVVRGNATRFDVREVFGRGEGIVVEAVTRGTGAPVRLTLDRDGDRLAVTGPGIATDLVRCDGDRTSAPADPTGQGDGPRYAYDETFHGTWRGLETSDCRRIVGTWTFGADTIIANGNRYRIRSFDGDPDAIGVAVTRAATGQETMFVVRPTAPGRATVEGPGFTTRLVQCD